MNWRCINSLKSSQDVGAFYLSTLKYANYLWQNATPARAILALNRGIYAQLIGSEPEYQQWPMPYAALRWLIEQGGKDERFLGNPRISYQHQADRLRGARLEIRKARAWACWAVARAAIPELEADPLHQVEEPTVEAIAKSLLQHGLPGEGDVWLQAINA